MEAVVRKSGGVFDGIHRIQSELLRDECDGTGQSSCTVGKPYVRQRVVESYGIESRLVVAHPKFSAKELTDLVAFDTSSFAITIHCIAYSSGAVLCSIQILGLGLAEHS